MVGSEFTDVFGRASAGQSFLKAVVALSHRRLCAPIMNYA
jgi:hypothetical protein